MRLSAAMNLGKFRPRGSRATERFEDAQISARCPACSALQTLAQARFTESAAVSEYKCAYGCDHALVRVRHPPGARIHMDNLTLAPLELNRRGRLEN